MANVNIPLTITRPGVNVVTPIGFQAYVTETPFQIPFRYPLADIANYTALKAAGFFRHGLKQYGLPAGVASAATSTELNPVGDNADVNPTLGYQLPKTEKLVLLVKVNTLIGAAVVTVTVKGSQQYRIEDQTFAIPATSAVGSVFEFPLYDFGILIQQGSGHIEISADSVTADDEEHLDFALVARSF
jgi:hypothetical protein